jgi:DNA-binding response OmpR family regulator
MITGRGDVVDRVVGLEVGADDYIAKPFNLREVLARVRTVLRRARPAGAAPEPAAEALRFEGWTIEPARRRVTAPDGPFPTVMPPAATWGQARAAMRVRMSSS